MHTALSPMRALCVLFSGRCCGCGCSGGGLLGHVAAQRSQARQRPISAGAFGTLPPSASRSNILPGQRIRFTARYAEIDASARTSSASASSTLDEEKVMSDMLGRIRECNYMPGEVRDELVNFVADGKTLGKATRKVARLLCSSSPSGDPIFRMEEARPGTDGSETLTLTAAAGRTCESRTEAVMSVMENLRSRGVIGGWRDELYPVSSTFYSEPTLLVERAAAPFLGALEYGIHVNGLVFDEGSSGGLKMWMARRSESKGKYPGMLDHIVAGGQPAGLGLMENVVKECEEEAGVPASLARECASPVGAISYETFTPIHGACGEDVDGVINRVVLFNYDLVVPPEFEPKPVDGEVDEFFLWGIDDIKRSMALDYHDPIKPNCYLVIIDYLLRAGHISPETPGYLDVLRELRSGSCC